MTQISVFLDVNPRVSAQAAAAAARELVTLFSRTGDEISAGLGTKLSRAFGALDAGAARRELEVMQSAYRRTADVEVESARRMAAAMGQVEVAQRRLGELTAKYGADSSRAAAANVALADSHARASKAQRDHVDAMVASEGAAAGLATSSKNAAVEVSRTGQMLNTVGIASVAGFGIAAVETTKKAADLQTQMTRLTASAGESAGNLKAVSDGILQMAGQVGYSVDDLSRAMYPIEKAGYRGADGINVLRSAAQGAKSENADLSEVLNGLTTSMHDFGFGSSQSADVMSKMVTATGMAKTNFQEFSGALHSVEPIAAGLAENLDAVGKAHLMSDVYGSLAQITQSGTSADQAAQNMGHTFTSLAKPTQQMRDMLGALGIDAQDLSEHLGERGLTGSLQVVSQAIAERTKNGQVHLDVQMQNTQAARAETEAFNALPPAAKAVAQQIKEGTLSYKEFRKSRGGLNVEMANELGQWNNLNNKLTGFSSAVKSGIGNQMDLNQALALAVGGQDNLRVALQLTGANFDATNNKIKAVDQTTREHDGTVKGFNETQETLNAKMADAKAAFGAAEAEIGSAFIPVMTDVANIAKSVGDTMAKHPGIMHAGVDALGLLGGAWLWFKGIGVAEKILTPIATGLGSIIAGEEGATAGAAGLKTALAGLAGAGATIAAATVAANSQDSAREKAGERSYSSMGWAEQAKQAIYDNLDYSDIGGPNIAGWFGWNRGYANKAAGGPLDAPGPKGKDSALFWGAAGEHVLTASDVDAMGGHAGVYAFRHALHRDSGGAVGADALYAEAQALNGHAYVWGSTDCSGAVSMLVDAALGTSGRMNTGNAESWLAAKGFQPGFQPGALNIGWYNSPGGPGGGHMAATLPDGTHFESGGQHGGIMMGGSAAGAETSEFTNHMFLPMEGLYPDGPAGGGSGGFGGGMGGFGGGGGGASPAAVNAANNRVMKAQDRLTEAKERETEVSQKATAKQSERDRAKDQVAEAERELSAAQQNQAQLQRGGGRGGGGGLSQFGVPLPDRFGLGKGLPGLAEWLVDFVGDLAVAPIEAQMAAQAGMAGFGGGSGGGGYASLPSASSYTTGLPFVPGSSGPSVSGPGGGGGVEAAAAVTPSGGGGPSAAPAAPAASSGRLGQVFDPTAFGVAPKHGPLGQSFDPTAFGVAPGTSMSLLPGIGGIPGVMGNPNAPALPNGPIAHVAPVPQFGAGGSSMSDLQAWGRTHPGLAGGTAPSGLRGDRGIGGPPEPGVASLFGDAPGFSGGGNVGSGQQGNGGPRGTDTVPAWLTPGEQVLSVDQAQAWRRAQYFVGGSGPSGVEDAGATAPAPAPPKPAAPAPKTTPDPNKANQPQAKSTMPQGEHPNNVEQADKQQAPTGGGIGSTGQGSKGLGISGGAIGTAEGAAAMGADMFAPGSGMGVQMASQLMNRTIAYGGQMAGVAVQGALSTIFPTDSPLSDFGNTLPGKILSGIAGAKPNAPQSAGATKAPLQRQDDSGGGGKGESPSMGGGMTINGMTVQANNADQFRYSLDQMQRQHQMDSNQYTSGRK